MKSLMVFVTLIAATRGYGGTVCGLSINGKPATQPFAIQAVQRSPIAIAVSMDSSKVARMDWTSMNYDQISQFNGQYLIQYSMTAKGEAQIEMGQINAPRTLKPDASSSRGLLKGILLSSANLKAGGSLTLFLAEQKLLGFCINTNADMK